MTPPFHPTSCHPSAVAAALDELRALVSDLARHKTGNTAVPGLSVMYSERTTTPLPEICEPMLCVVLQGRKRVGTSDLTLEYAAAEYLVVSMDIPIRGAICEASSQEPYLALSLRLNPHNLHELLSEFPPEVSTVSETSHISLPALGLSTLSADLMASLSRLLRLLHQPEDIPVLAPLIIKEIMYRLLKGNQGPLLRTVCATEGKVAQIQEAIRWLRKNYMHSFEIDSMAQVAHMSLSSFYRHFRSVTTMSPLQYQKCVRLQAARQLLISQEKDAAGAAFTVGYESASQFSREYKRMFGNPPGREKANSDALLQQRKTSSFPDRPQFARRLMERPEHR